MQYRPPGRFDPPRQRPPGSRFLALGAIAVLPALLVSGFIVLRSQGADVQPSQTTMTVASRMGDPAEEPARFATPEATEDLEPAPASLGVPPPEITATAAIVVDGGSLAVLYDRNGRERRAPASVTKIATAIVALEQGRLDDKTTSDVHYWNLGDSSTMGIEPGDTLTLRDLLYGLMLVSGNDAATVIGRHISGSDDAFVAEMNELVDRLGLQDTHFANADGLSAPEHYSSAYDIVLLSRYLMRFPDLRTIVGTETYTATAERNEETVEFDLYNHNPLLNYTPGVDGIKTGFTEEAGRTFAVSATRNGHRVYVVLLDTTLRAQDSQAMIEWAFANHRWGDEPATTAEGTFEGTGAP